jgi:hypothetical protein
MAGKRLRDVLSREEFIRLRGQERMADWVASHDTRVTATVDGQ